MKAVKTENSDHNFGPPEGTPEGEILDLPCQKIMDGDKVDAIRSVWEISDDERKMIANGANIELDVWWIGAFPPVRLRVTGEKAVAE